MNSLATLEDNQFLYEYLPPAQNKTVDHEIVEISSDEETDADNGQPESSTSAAKRAVEFWEDGHELYVETHELNPSHGPTRIKRQRLGENVIADVIPKLPDVAYRGRMSENLLYTPGFNGTPERTDQNLIQPQLNVLTGSAPTETAPPSLVEHDNKNLLLLSDQPFAKDIDQDPQPLQEQDLDRGNAPYFFDRKLHTAMYCGPGYERFPVALEKKPEHIKVCDEWDQKHVVNQSLSSNQMYKPNAGPERVDAADQECLRSVLEVLPDVQHRFVLRIIQENTETVKNDDDDNDIHVRPTAAQILAIILEHADYPKQEKVDATEEAESDGTGVTIKWQKGDTANKIYQKSAVGLLAGHFPHVPTHFIHRTVKDKKTAFDAYCHISDLESKYWSITSRNRPYRRSQGARLTLEKKYSTKEECRSTDQWRNLINEMQAAKQRVERERIRTDRIRQQEAREMANLEEHIAEGNIVECQCCFDEQIPVNRAVSCDGDQLHWFCFSCVKSLADNQVGSMKHEMSCMDGSGCKAALNVAGVALAVPTKTFDKLAFFKQQNEIAAAGIEGLEECPFCDFKAICDPIEEDPIFRCQKPECRRATCRRCHEDGHGSKSCDEARKDKGLSARHQIEEARSEAMMRTCPQCKVKIVKADGCNKMTCSNCKCSMCYVCQVDITNNGKSQGYEHFHGPGATCALHDKGYNRHQREADEAEREAIKKVQAENAEFDENELQIETGANKKRAKGDANGVKGMTEQGYHPFAFDHMVDVAPARGLDPFLMNQVESVQERLERGRRFREMLEEQRRAEQHHLLADAHFFHQAGPAQFGDQAGLATTPMQQRPRSRLAEDVPQPTNVVTQPLNRGQQTYARQDMYELPMWGPAAYATFDGNLGFDRKHQSNNGNTMARQEPHLLPPPRPPAPYQQQQQQNTVDHGYLTFPREAYHQDQPRNSAPERAFAGWMEPVRDVADDMFVYNQHDMRRHLEADDNYHVHFDPQIWQ